MVLHPLFSEGPFPYIKLDHRCVIWLPSTNRCHLNMWSRRVFWLYVWRREISYFSRCSHDVVELLVVETRRCVAKPAACCRTGCCRDSAASRRTCCALLNCLLLGIGGLTQKLLPDAELPVVGIWRAHAEVVARCRTTRWRVLPALRRTSCASLSCQLSGPRRSRAGLAARCRTACCQDSAVSR